MIYEINGKEVMLDSDLAKLYRVETKRINEAVSRNPKKFPSRFAWELSIKETQEISRSQFATLNIKQGLNIKYGARVFTEQGIYMLMAVLKGEKAVEQSKALIRIFKGMKDYLINNNLINQNYINNLVMKQENLLLDYDFRLSRLETKVNELRKIDRIFLRGNIYDAYSFILDIFNSTSKELIIIDNYASKEILDIISKLSINVKIISKNLDKDLINKYSKQYSNITFIQNDSFHDRFIIVDNNMIFNIGSSIKDLGKKICFVSKIYNEEIKMKILNEINL
jgi:hypothetical protein